MGKLKWLMGVVVVFVVWTPCAGCCSGSDNKKIAESIRRRRLTIFELLFWNGWKHNG